MTQRTSHSASDSSSELFGRPFCWCW